MTATLQEIAERTRHAALLELLEQQQADPETPIEVSSEATNQEQVKSAFRVLVVAAFDDESLDIKATLVRIKEILKSYEKLVGRIAGDDDADVDVEEVAAADAMSEGFLASLGEFRSELTRLREDLARLLPARFRAAIAGGGRARRRGT